MVSILLQISFRFRLSFGTLLLLFISCNSLQSKVKKLRKWQLYSLSSVWKDIEKKSLCHNSTSNIIFSEYPVIFFHILLLSVCLARPTRELFEYKVYTPSASNQIMKSKKKTKKKLISDCNMTTWQHNSDHVLKYQPDLLSSSTE